MKINLIGKNNSKKLKELVKVPIPSVKILEKSFKESPENSVGNLPTVLSKNHITMFIKKSRIDIFYLKKCFM